MCLLNFTRLFVLGFVTIANLANVNSLPVEQQHYKGGSAAVRKYLEFNPRAVHLGDVGNISYFMDNSELIDWYDAVAVAINNGFAMASFSNPDEFEFFTNISKELLPEGSYWVGAIDMRDSRPHERYSWYFTGQPFSSGNFNFQRARSYSCIEFIVGFNYKQLAAVECTLFRRGVLLQVTNTH